jgi:hypothetical protein
MHNMSSPSPGLARKLLGTEVPVSLCFWPKAKGNCCLSIPEGRQAACVCRFVGTVCVALLVLVGKVPISTGVALLPTSTVPTTNKTDREQVWTATS